MKLSWISSVTSLFTSNALKSFVFESCMATLATVAKVWAKVA